MKTKRIHQIDLARGVGIILMVIFHFFVNLDLLGFMQINLWEPPIIYLAIPIQVLFIVSTAFTLQLTAHKGIPRRIKHALKLAFWAMLITAITWLIYQEQAVKFGILHFYSAAILFSLPILKNKWLPVLLAIPMLIATPFLAEIPAQSTWLFPLGITQPGFASLDYFPLFPWLGVFWMGLTAAHLILPKLNSRSHSKHLEWIGRYSLHIYLVHQPILFGGLWLLKAL